MSTDDKEKDLYTCKCNEKKPEKKKLLPEDLNEDVIEEWEPFKEQLLTRGYTKEFQIHGAFAMWQKKYPEKEILHYLRLLPLETDFNFIAAAVEPYKKGAYELTEAPK